jgi:anti-sigma B factor antagonist
MEPDSAFRVVVCEVDGRSLVRITGDLDASSSPTLREALLALLDVGQRAISVDLTDVTFMDSTGVGVLIDVVRAGGEVIIVGASARARRVLDLTGITSLDEVHEAFARN